MAVIRPFKAVRPRKDLAQQVAALPYDVMNSEEARQMAEGNPYSFLHVDKAEIDLSPEIDLYDSRVYARARENLDKMINDQVLIQDENSCFYIYRQVMQGRAQTGLVVCASIDDYMQDIIKKHEHTRADKELDRIKHVDICDANTGPIFLTYPSREKINELISQWTVKAPLYDFFSEDGINHTVWIINDEAAIALLIEYFRDVQYFYIADGHHRCASAVKVGQQRRQQNPSYTGNEEFNFFLAVLFPDQDLCILDYNRVVKDLNGLTLAEFLDKLSAKFEVIPYKNDKPFKPCARHSFGMFIDKQWYELKAIPGTYDADDPVKSLDVSILQNNLLDPILGIKDPRTDKRIDFIGGIRGMEELERRVNTDMRVAFSLYPTSVKELMKIADAGLVMPPKSTWFEPKLRSGLFIHKLS